MENRKNGMYVTNNHDINNQTSDKGKKHTCTLSDLISSTFFPKQTNERETSIQDTAPKARQEKAMTKTVGNLAKHVHDWATVGNLTLSYSGWFHRDPAACSIQTKKKVL